jgi:hypothetical protein
MRMSTEEAVGLWDYELEEHDFCNIKYLDIGYEGPQEA